MTDKNQNANNPYTSTIVGRISTIFREKGLYFLLRKLWAKMGRLFYAHTLLRFRKPIAFTFCGKAYQQFYHPYSSTWDNERSVEIPIALDFISQNTHGRILEVGNVLSHYVLTNWDIVDKFELAPGVIQDDVITFDPKEPYDFIICISTLEHVGFDDDIREPSLIPRAVENLRYACLKQGGRMLFTVPLGYNQYLDHLLFSGGLGFTNIHYMLRTDRFIWQEASADEVKRVGYGTSYIEAGAIAIIEYINA